VGRLSFAVDMGPVIQGCSPLAWRSEPDLCSTKRINSSYKKQQVFTTSNPAEVTLIRVRNGRKPYLLAFKIASHFLTYILFLPESLKLLGFG